MPYAVKPKGDKFVVVTTDSGKVHGTFDTKDEADKQLEALYANAPPSKEKASKSMFEGFLTEGVPDKGAQDLMEALKRAPATVTVAKEPVAKANPEGINQYSGGKGGGKGPDKEVVAAHQKAAADHKEAGMKHNEEASKIYQQGGKPSSYSDHRAAAQAHYDAAKAHEYAAKFAPGAKNADAMGKHLAQAASAKAEAASAKANTNHAFKGLL